MLVAGTKHRKKEQMWWNDRNDLDLFWPEHLARDINVCKYCSKCRHWSFFYLLLTNSSQKTSEGPSVLALKIHSCVTFLLLKMETGSVWPEHLIGVNVTRSTVWRMCSSLCSWWLFDTGKHNLAAAACDNHKAELIWAELNFCSDAIEGGVTPFKRCPLWWSDIFEFYMCSKLTRAPPDVDPGSWVCGTNVLF